MAPSEQQEISVADFEAMFGELAGDYLKECIHSYNLRYRPLTPEEEAYWMGYTRGILENRDVPKAGAHRQEQ